MSITKTSLVLELRYVWNAINRGDDLQHSPQKYGSKCKYDVDEANRMWYVGLRSDLRRTHCYWWWWWWWWWWGGGGSIFALCLFWDNSMLCNPGMVLRHGCWLFLSEDELHSTERIELSKYISDRNYWNPNQVALGMCHHPSANMINVTGYLFYQEKEVSIYY